MNPLIIQVGVGEITLGMTPELAWLMAYLSNEALLN
jgi:hypothetical protein